MSASRIPIFQPSAASESARLTAVVDLPTPPLPDATAMMRLMPGMARLRGAAGRCWCPGAGWACDVAATAGFSDVNVTTAPVASGSALIADSASRRIVSIASGMRGLPVSARYTLSLRIVRPAIPLERETAVRPSGPAIVASALRTSVSPNMVCDPFMPAAKLVRGDAHIGDGCSQME